MRISWADGDIPGETMACLLMKRPACLLMKNAMTLVAQLGLLGLVSRSGKVWNGRWIGLGRLWGRARVLGRRWGRAVVLRRLWGRARVMGLLLHVVWGFEWGQVGSATRSVREHRGSPRVEDIRWLDT